MIDKETIAESLTKDVLFEACQFLTREQMLLIFFEGDKNLFEWYATQIVKFSFTQDPEDIRFAQQEIERLNIVMNHPTIGIKLRLE